MEKPQPPDSSLWEKLDEARTQLPWAQPPPEDSFSIRDYAEKYSVGHSTAKEHIQKLLRKGLLELAGSVRNKKFYRPTVG